MSIRQPFASAGIYWSTCKGQAVPADKCAILYDEEDCGGWAYEVPVGYTKLSGWSISGPQKNDAESVLVRQGCKFIGMANVSQLMISYGITKF